MVRIWHVHGIMCAVCFIRVSQVMCLLPGLGRRPQTELHSDGAGFAGQQHRSSRGKGLVFGLFVEDGVMRGVGVKKGTGRIETQPFEGKHAVQRWISGGNAQKGAKKVCLRKRVSMSFPRNKLVKLCKNQQPRKSKEMDSVGLCINKQVACLRYLTLLFSLVNYVQITHCSLSFLLYSTKLEIYLRFARIDKE